MKKIVLVRISSEFDHYRKQNSSCFSEMLKKKIGVLLHAMVEVGRARTMKLRIFITWQMVLVLVDSRSTHSFIDTMLVMSLLVTWKANMRLMVANGEQVCGEGVCHNISLHFSSCQFQVDLYTLALVGVDVVLGVNLLMTLKRY